MDVGAALVAFAKYNKLQGYRPYGHPLTLCGPDNPGVSKWSNKPWQLDFHAAGARNKERMAMCANGVGKTVAGAAETAYHATGLYPSWWTGFRFRSAPNPIWVGSITNEMQRDGPQAALIGDLGENLGTGYIPAHLLTERPRTRQAGVSGVADIISVRHVTGDTVNIVCKTYEQGWRKWQAAAPKIVWLDEEPDENNQDQRDIFAEAQTRVFRSGGILYVTYTPLLGETQLTRHFMYPKAPGIWWCGATWDDVSHLQEEDKARLRASYPQHQAESRTMGVPMMGEGRIFDMPENDMRVTPFEIPWHWARIKGVDFGLDHPSAFCDLAWDRDRDILYLVRTWSKANCSVEEHAAAINQFDPWVPVAWPHDGTTREKSNGVRIRDHFAAHGVHMLGKSARYKNETGGRQPVEPIVLEMQRRMAGGGFKVFDHQCNDFWQEYRSYHRRDGRIHAHKDDVLKSVFYAVMMRRYATTRQVHTARQESPSNLLSIRV